MNAAWLIHIPLICLLSWLMWKWVSKTAFRQYYLPALFIKLLCGIGVTALYQWYYGFGDTLFYAASAQSLADIAYADPAQYLRIALGTEAAPSTIMYANDPRAFFFVRIISPLAIIGCDIWLMSIYLSLTAFFGTLFLVVSLHNYLKLSPSALAFSFLFFPSFVFWSSGLMKESLLLASIGLAVGALVKVVVSKLSIKSVALFLLMAFLLIFMLYLKYYYSAVLAALFLATSVAAVNLKFFNSTLAAAIVFVVVLLVGAFSTSFLHPNLNLTRVAEAIHTNHDKSLAFSQTGDAIPLLNEDGDNWVTAAPKALLVGLFSPMPWQANDLLSMTAAIENVFTAILLLSLIYFFIKEGRRKISGLHKLLLLTCIMYIISMATLLALASPNLGSLLRYRTGFQPFFILLVCMENPYFHKVWKKFAQPAHV